jgi:hypothetical protein
MFDSISDFSSPTQGVADTLRAAAQKLREAGPLAAGPDVDRLQEAFDELREALRALPGFRAGADAAASASVSGQGAPEGNGDRAIPPTPLAAPGAAAEAPAAPAGGGTVHKVVMVPPAPAAPAGGGTVHKVVMVPPRSDRR